MSSQCHISHKIQVFIHCSSAAAVNNCTFNGFWFFSAVWLIGITFVSSFRQPVVRSFINEFRWVRVDRPHLRSAADRRGIKSPKAIGNWLRSRPAWTCRISPCLSGPSFVKLVDRYIVWNKWHSLIIVHKLFAPPSPLFHPSEIIILINEKRLDNVQGGLLGALGCNYWSSGGQ